MKTFLKKTLIIILLICILLPSLFSNMALAVDNTVYLTTERAGNYIANFAILYYENFKDKTYYGSSAQAAYNGNPDASGKYSMTDYGFINFAIHQSLGIGGSTYTTFITQSTQADEYFNEVTISSEKTEEMKKLLNDDGTINITEAMSASVTLPGDVLIAKNGVVFLYVGAGQVIYCTSDLTNKAENGIKYEYMHQYFTRKRNELEKGLAEGESLDMGKLTQYEIVKILRVKGDEEGFTQIPETNANLIFAGKGYNDVNNSYYGIPQFGYYAGSESLFGWLIDLFKDILNYLIGIITLGIKIELIGWTDIASNLMSDTILKLSGQDTNRTTSDEINGVAPTSQRAEKVTIETMIFNKVGILDVNIFNLKQAGGVELGEDSVIYSLKQLVAQWYYIIRLVSIIIMLVVLLYVGLRLVLTSISEKKAVYKKVLIDWVVGFVIIFVIHYFMMVIIYLNESILNILAGIMDGTQNGVSIYETIRTKAYALKFTEGFVGTIMYMYLVYITVKFLFVYLKRYLTINILALLGPIMGIRYALDKVGGKKTSKSLIGWMFDFTMNVFIQLVHALLYVAFMSIAYNIATQSVAGFICALIVMNFMLKADKIIMKIFRFDQSSSVGDTAQPESLLEKMGELYGGIHIITNLGKGIFRFGGNTLNTKYEKYANFIEKRTGKDIKKSVDMAKYRVSAIPAKALRKMSFGRINTLRSRIGDTKDYELNKQLYEALKLQRKMKNKSFTRAVGFGKDVLGGAGRMLVGIPMAIAEPGAGLTMMIGGYKTLKGNLKNSNKLNEGRKARVAMKAASYKNLEEKYLDNVLKLQQSDNMINKLDKHAIEQRKQDLQHKIEQNNSVIDQLTDAGDIKGRELLEKENRKFKKYIENLEKPFKENEELKKLCEEQKQEIYDKYDEYQKLLKASGTSMKVIDDMGGISKKVIKAKKKLETIEKAQNIEKEIQEIYKDLKNLQAKDAIDRQLKPEEARKELSEQVNQTVKNATKKYVTLGTIKTAIQDYAYENNIRKIQSSDAEGVIASLEKVLQEGGSKVQLSKEAKENVRKQIDAEINKKSRNGNLLIDDAVSAVNDGLIKKGSIKTTRTKEVKNQELKEKYDSIEEKVRRLRALNDKSITKYGGKVCDIHKFMSEIQN